MIKIGTKTIDTNIFLAPLSGCSDLPFRLLCREHGARFCFFEMLDAHSLIYEHRQTFSILKTRPDDTPIAAQLVGADPLTMLRAAEKLLKLVDITFLDINCACPAKKIIRKKAGAHLLRDIKMLCGIVKNMASSLPIPITVKMRLGYDTKDERHIVDTVKRCEDSGASAIFVHGRTSVQGHMGDIDYQSIRTIKNSIAIPVFGVGNILTPQLAEKMFVETGCDGILVARGALGNPCIFKDIENYLRDGTPPPERTMLAKKRILKKHLSYVKKYKDIKPHSMIGYMRKVALWYVRNFPKAARMREQIVRAKDYEEMARVIDAI